MSDLLPANATPQEKALSEAIARLGDVPPNVRDAWNADTCPAAVLPWLAWAYSVDSWDASWSDEQKRETVKQSLLVHKRKGTIGAVREALAALGVTAEVSEWFNYSGDPFTFRLVLESNQTPLSQSGIAAALTVINNSKNLRSHLDLITIRARSESPIFVGAVAHVGSEITVLFETPL